jgi:predicted dehydrogenase
MLLPHLAGKEGVALRHVATNRSLSALDARRRFGFSEASTDAEAVLADDSLEAIFIVTRHHSHADLTCRALRAGKAVFVEKPLALSQEQLSQVMDTVNETGNDRLMVGFNRRFAPMLVEMKARFGTRAAGSVARYSVNAGQLGTKSWYGDEKLEGSRFAGEGGHFIDTLAWWFDAVPTEVYSMASKDPHDIQVNLRFSDGSVAVISYVTNGNPRYPKEILDVAVSGRTARLDNFRRATVWSGRRKKVTRVFGAVDKGQAAQIEAFLGSVRSGAPMPISLDSLNATTKATLAVATSQASGRPEPV